MWSAKSLVESLQSQQSLCAKMRVPDGLPGGGSSTGSIACRAVRKELEEELDHCPTLDPGLAIRLPKRVNATVIF